MRKPLLMTKKLLPAHIPVVFMSRQIYGCFANAQWRLASDLPG
jgi:hypothetical protein